MVVCYSQFEAAMYREHIEEASFLYEQRLVLREDDETSWVALQEGEDRIAAHLDALVIGGDMALGVANELAQDIDEVGLIYALSALYAHQQQPAMWQAMVESLDLADSEMMHAFIDATVMHVPDSWQSLLYRMLIEESVVASEAQRHFCLAQVCGARGWASVSPDVEKAQAQRSVLSSRSILDPLHEWPLCQAALSAASTSIEAKLTKASNASNAGDERNKSGPDRLMALALLGDWCVVETLVAALQDDGLAPMAARALFTLTGAYLTESVFVPEAPDSDDEKHRRRNEGVAPTRPDGTPLGEHVEQLCVDPVRWAAWVAQYQTQFEAGKRYRFGRLITPTVLVAVISRPESDSLLRQACYVECCLRYGASAPFDVNASVGRQWMQLQTLRAWAEQASRHVSAGLYYWNSKIVDVSRNPHDGTS